MKKPILRTAISVSSDTGMPIAAMTQVPTCLFSMITGKGHQKADKKTRGERSQIGSGNYVLSAASQKIKTIGGGISPPMVLYVASWLPLLFF
jgi:hypothetical protein